MVAKFADALRRLDTECERCGARGRHTGDECARRAARVQPCPDCGAQRLRLHGHRGRRYCKLLAGVREGLLPAGRYYNLLRRCDVAEKRSSGSVTSTWWGPAWAVSLLDAMRRDGTLPANPDSIIDLIETWKRDLPARDAALAFYTLAAEGDDVG